MAQRRLAALQTHLGGGAGAAASAPAAAAPDNAGPLSGVRIIDLSQMVSGPMCCGILADQGAEVIKVEPVSGDATRAMSKTMSSTFCVINRNKRSVSLDLKRPEGLGLLRQLVRTADVVVQNFRPGAADRLGIGYDSLSRERPGLIYLSISGFGEKGPYAHKRVYDPVIQAVAGLPSIQADESGRPRMMRLIIPDKVTALTAAQAVTAALLHRAKTGRGQHVRLSMLDSVTAFMWPEGMGAHTFTRQNTEMKALMSKGGMYSRDLVFKLRDGYITCGTVSMAEWQGLCKALDKPEWLRDPRFRDAAGVAAHRDARMGMVQEALSSWTCADALATLDKHQVPCAPINHPRERVLEDPQLIANGSILEAEHPIQGGMRFARPAAQFADSEFRLREHAPLIGQHNDAVLAELGVTAAERERLRAAGVLRKEPGMH
eukprot:TRINITY_DN11839_c0_g1_i2.p1 TRINITY_DN11839_c0_g1~~TRINITY_DN11839_c0_g1_i2.p1  ORF type:complete len:459 (+),score=156.78 TRINITY_DN11839_c0_g1_i2:82-1377(+)